ncbi:MAG: luciferase, partial [Haloferacaceae archaeon]
MTTLSEETDAAAARAGLDAAALKPTECAVGRGAALPLSTVVVDYEGREHLPDDDALRALARDREVRLTTPVRVAGFDPLADGNGNDPVPEGVGRVLVAGNPAYLTEAEASRAVAPRLVAARERHPGAWVGTEGVERVALAAGGTQFELLSRTTAGDVRALRTAGFDGEI